MKTKRRMKLEDIKIASPCPASWEEMLGDEKVRFCNICSKHVYNLSAMTKAEAQLTIDQSAGGFCARIYMRTDGTIMSSDCPVGLAKLRKTIARRLVAITALAAGIISGVTNIIVTHLDPPRLEITTPDPHVKQASPQSKRELLEETETIQLMGYIE